MKRRVWARSPQRERRSGRCGRGATLILAPIDWRRRLEPIAIKTFEAPHLGDRENRRAFSSRAACCLLLISDSSQFVAEAWRAMQPERAAPRQHYCSSRITVPVRRAAAPCPTRRKTSNGRAGSAFCMVSWRLPSSCICINLRELSRDS